MERTKEERQSEIKPIIIKLRELHLHIAYEPIKELFTQMQKYIQEGIRIELNIPFPAMNVIIKGVLAIQKREKVWVKLEHPKKG
jgi:hypothetical protein